MHRKEAVWMDELFRLIFSADFVASVLRMSTPILFVGLAAMVGDKADVLCVAYEGIMLFAAFGGVVGSALLHSLAGGLTGGLLAGLVITGIFAYFVLYMDAKPMLIGLALNILASAGTVFGLYLITGSKANSANLGSMAFSEIHIPVVENIPVIGGIVSGHNTLTYFVFLCVFLVQILLYRTPLGLRIRTAGEAPLAAASVGINVSKTKFIALIISGLLASMGGIFMSMAYLPYFTRDMVAGRGFIGIAAQSLGAGSPLLTMVWTMVFGAADALGSMAQSFRLPSQFAQMTPYLVTLIGLVLMNIPKKVRK